MRFFLFLFYGLFSFSNVFSGEQPAPTGLLCELLSSPELSVITDPTPEFGWIVNSNLKSDYQTAYQILVAVSKDRLNDRESMQWNSGKVFSARSSNVEYDGKELPANSALFWKVRIWNKKNEPSVWSEPQRLNTGVFDAERSCPGESRWVQIELADQRKLWTFENRHPIGYHKVDAVKKVPGDDVVFFDFGRSAFGVPEIQYKWEPASPGIRSDTLWVNLGEKAVGDSIDREPGGGVLFRKIPFPIAPGSHKDTLALPRFVPRYPHSQAMPEHMPEVIPFRFLEVSCENPDVEIEKVTRHGLYYLFNENASFFSCSDSRLNAVYDLCRYSVKANTFNGDYAASERERMLYEADCFIHQMSHYAVDREFAIARYSLENMIFHATWPTEWIFHTILMAYADYWHTGNTEIIDTYFSELSAKLMLELTSENYLISTRTGKQSPDFLKSIHFNGKELRDIVDWPHGGMGLNETNGETDNYDFTTYNTVVNAFHYKALLAMAEMASAIGKKGEEINYKNRSALVKRAFNNAFYNSEKGIYVDGLKSDHSSLHANMFALVFGLAEDEQKPKVIDYIKSKGMACGVYGANYLLEALFNEKEGKYAIGLLTSDSDRSWMNMLRAGSTITTEAWDNRYKSNNGWSHAWSSSPAHIIPRKMIGIEPLVPGFKKIRIAPQTGEISQAKCKLPTIKGPVFVQFSQNNETFQGEIEIPHNTTAQFIIPPAFSSGTVMVNGKERIPEHLGGDFITYLEAGKHSVHILNASK